MSQTFDQFKDNKSKYYKLFLDKNTRDQYIDFKNCWNE